MGFDYSARGFLILFNLFLDILCQFEGNQVSSDPSLLLVLYPAIWENEGKPKSGRDGNPNIPSSLGVPCLVETSPSSVLVYCVRKILILSFYSKTVLRKHWNLSLVLECHSRRVFHDFYWEITEGFEVPENCKLRCLIIITDEWFITWY